MSIKTSNPEAKSINQERFGPDGRDRRRRHRAKVTLSVHIRGGMGEIDLFEDYGVTIDASRDGLLVMTRRGGYSTGQDLDVKIASFGELTELVLWQPARVVRSFLIGDQHCYALALEYQKAEAANPTDEYSSNYLPAAVRVLLVESDLLAAGLARNLLQQEGYEVVHVSNGRQSLDFLHREIPDVVLAAVEDGEGNGRELCSIMKNSARLQHVPVILLIRSTRPADYSACHAAGAAICMAIPYAPEKLQQALRLVAPSPLLRSPYSAQFI